MMFGIDLESVVWCLAASVVWAPFVYLAAARCDVSRGPTTSEMLWLAALFVSALPTLIAPALAAAGISLRPPVVEAPVIAAAEMVRVAMPAAETAAAPASVSISLATLIDAIGLLYFYGAILAFGVWLTRTALFAAHVRKAQPVDFPELLTALEDWRRRLGVKAQVQVRSSDAVSSVCVYGYFRPVIIIPSSLNARISFDDLVMMGAHEIAHVRRGDGAFFTLCAIARIFFWFNPFVKRIAARAELAAEQGADSLVIEAGADRRAYAACFVEGLRFAAERAQLTRVAVPSFTPFDRKSRRERLDAILSGETPESRQPSKLLIATLASLAGALAFAQAALAVNPEHIKARAPSLAQMPVDGEITLAYGERADILGADQPAHGGVDIKAATGTPVRAPADGVVIEATDVYQGKPAWGKVVVVRHGDGLKTRYAHLDSYAVRKGDRVAAGDVIGEVGATGEVTGPHLHFETIVDDKRVDPVVAASAPKPKPARKPVPAVAPSPAPRAVPAANPSPALEAELAGGSAASTTAVRPTEPVEFSGFAVAGPDTVIQFRTSDGETSYTLRAGDRTDYRFENAMSAADQKRLRQSLQAMHKQIEKAKKEHARAMSSMRFAMPDVHREIEVKNFDMKDIKDLKFEGFEFADMKFEPGKIADFSAKASAMAQEAAARWTSDHERAVRDIEREAERAERLAERETARAEREAERAAQEAERMGEWEAARAEREQAQEEARLEREEARLEREDALREAQLSREEARIELEESIRERAEALAEAEQSLNEERAEIERLKAELRGGLFDRDEDGE